MLRCWKKCHEKCHGKWVTSQNDDNFRFWSGDTDMMGIKIGKSSVGWFFLWWRLHEHIKFKIYRHVRHKRFFCKGYVYCCLRKKSVLLVFFNSRNVIFQKKLIFFSHLFALINSLLCLDNQPGSDTYITLIWKFIQHRRFCLKQVKYNWEKE